MAHEPGATLQQAGGIGQCMAVKKTHVYVRGEDVDIGEGDISQTGNRAAVVQELADFIAALPHQLKPLMGDRSQFTGVLFHPFIDGRITLDSAVKPQQVCWDRHDLLGFPTRQIETEVFGRRNYSALCRTYHIWEPRRDMGHPIFISFGDASVCQLPWPVGWH